MTDHGSTDFATAAIGIIPMNEREFELFQALIYRKAGIFLSSAKKNLLEARLGKRLRELRLESYAAYHDRISRDGGELTELLDRVATNETRFFREPAHFNFLTEKVFPQWRAAAAGGPRRRIIRAWSAGCATGEEPYSLAMTLIDHFPVHAGWRTDVFATDLSSRALAAARTAVWPIAKAKEIPLRYLKRFMLRGTGGRHGKMKAGPEIRAAVRFARLNLNDDVYPPIGLFDLILCRNVLIYFDAASRKRAIDRLLDRLLPCGYLLVGHAESLGGISHRLRFVLPAVYRLAPPEESRYAASDQFARHSGGSE